jgi:transcription elongation factor Elf1
MSEKINPGAYQGKLTCPFCESAAQRFVENVTPMRLRYRCRKCGLTYQYDISNRSDLNPYAAYGKGTVGSKLRKNIDDILRGRKMKGRMN